MELKEPMSQEEEAAFCALVEQIGGVTSAFRAAPNGMSIPRKQMIVMIAAASVAGGWLGRFTVESRVDARAFAIRYMDEMVQKMDVFFETFEGDG